MLFPFFHTIASIYVHLLPSQGKEMLVLDKKQYDRQVLASTKYICLNELAAKETGSDCFAFFSSFLEAGGSWTHVGVVSSGDRAV